MSSFVFFHYNLILSYFISINFFCSQVLLLRFPSCPKPKGCLGWLIRLPGGGDGADGGGDDDGGDGAGGDDADDKNMMTIRTRI